MPFKYATLQDRLLANSMIKTYDKKLGPCHIWTGKRNKDGYGLMSERSGDRVLSLSVHKVAFTRIANKAVPKGKELSHLCHNEACWNPAHITAETHKQNVARKS